VYPTLGAEWEESAELSAQVGGQLVYPTLGAEWEESAELSAAIEDALAAANRPGVGYASVSIELGRATVLDH
jgi:hypothetical protein